MAGVDDYLSQFVAPSGGAVVNAPVVPPAPVDPAALAAVTGAASDPIQGMLANLSMDEGTTRTSENPIFNDFATLSAWDFQNKYGADVFADMGRIASGRQQVVAATNTDRTDGERVTDAASGIAKGLIGGVADAGTLVAGAINRDAGVWAAETTKGFRDWMDKNTQTVANNTNRWLSGLRSELDSEDNQRQYDKDKETQSSFMAGLSYLGRGFINGATRLYEDDQALEMGLAEGIGSLFAGGPIARGIGVVGKLAGVGKAATAATMSAAIGMMEGGSAYSGAVQQVMEMTHEQLLANSPTYREQIASGIKPNIAKDNVAARAGEIAATIQTPIAAVTGKLVAGFEAAPLGAKGFREMVHNIVHETVEEGIQSATGQLGQNIGVQQTADTSLNILKDVGDQTAQGAILGSMTAGVVQAPKLPVALLNDAVGALKARGQAIREANAAGSGVTDADLRAAGQTLSENIAPISEAVVTASQSVPEGIKPAIAVNTLKNRIENTVNLSEADIRAAGPVTLQGMQTAELPVPQNKLEFIQSLAHVAMREDLSMEARQGAALYLLDQIDRSEKLANEDLNEVMSEMDQASPEYQGLKEFQSLIGQLKASKRVMDTINWINSNTSLNISKNADPQTVQNAVHATASAPTALGAQGARTILKQADQGTITVTPEQRKALRNTEVAMDIAEKARAEIQQTELTENAENVSQQVLNKGMDNDWGLSLNQHIGRINAALQTGDNELAGAALRNFGNFARSQMNKANAFIRSAENGGPQQYSTVDAYGRSVTGRKPVQYHANSPRSAALARQVIIEANMLIDQFNAMAEANPELGIPRRLTPVDRIEKFFGTAPVTSPETATNDSEQQTKAAVEQGPVEEVIASTVQEAPPVEVKTETEKSSIEKLFPFLNKPKNGIIRFYQAFSGNRTGRLLKYGRPIDELRAALEQDGSMEKFGLEPEQMEALQDYLSKGLSLIDGKNGKVDPSKGLAGSIIQRMQTFARQKYSKNGPDTDQMWKRIKDGEDIAAYIRGHALAIVENVDGKYQYNPALLETAVLASLHWFAGSQNRISNMDKETLAKNLGVDISELTNEKVVEFNGGVGLTQAVRGLAENITKFWGLEANKDAPQNLVKGIPEAIAKEILGAMEAMGWMTSGEVTIPGRDVAFRQYYFGENIDPTIREILREIGPARKLLEEVGLNAEDRNGPTFNQPPKHVASTQMRNKAVKNTKTQRGVIRKAQAIPYYFYRNSYDMQRAITADGWIELMGSTPITENKPFNKEHMKTVKGRNLTITMAFDAMYQQLQEAEAEARISGSEVDNIPKYYQFNYSRVNRLQMLGVNNPQSDKIARHVWLPTRATIDMTDDTSPAAVGFWMAIAQGLGDAFGHKPQHWTREENAAYGRSLIENSPVSSLVQELSQWLKDGKKGSLVEWSQRLRKAAPGITEHGVMSMLTAAEYLNAEDLSKFTTHNYFEADGITNGPANALMNLTSEITPEWVTTVAKAGAFIGQQNMSMTSQKGQDDLYQTASRLLTDLQQSFEKTLPDSVRDVYQSMLNVMQGLGMKIKVEDGQIKIERKVLKNPLTITIYGSGIDGIAGNVASEMLDNLYEALTDHMQSRRNAPFGEDMTLNGEPYSAQQFWTDLQNITDTRVVNNEGELSVEKAVGARTEIKVPSNAQLADIKISPKDFRTLRDNVRNLFVNNMAEAIDQSVMGHVKQTVDNIQKATNAQSIIMSYMFRKEVLKEMAKLQEKPGYRQGDFLSQEALDAILNRLMPYGAVINTDHQSYFLGSGERSDLMTSVVKHTVNGKEITVKMPQAFSRSLMDDLKTAAYAYAPSIAGVAGVPSFNIGTGDGRMIDVFLDGLKGFGVLPVFDGINLPVDRIFEGSQMANSAVMQSWSENPAQHVADGFRAWLALNPLEQMFDKTDPFNVEIDNLVMNLSRNAEGIRTADALTQEELAARMDLWSKELDIAQQAIADRVQAMRDIGMSVDQMAGGSTPYVQKGIIDIPPNASPAQIAMALAQRIKQVAAARTKGEAVSAPSREFVNAFRQKAGTDPDTGALVADVAALDAIRKTLNNKLPNALREMLNASLASLSDSGIKVIFGTPEMVDRYEQNNYPNTYEGDAGSYLGKIDVENNVIYLTNPAAETLAHELLHAATITKMQGYYSDKSSVSVADGEAIARLEGLMNEWLARSYDREGPPVAAAHRMAVSAIMNFRNQGRMPEALNEFLAWSLTNQNIIALQKKMQVQNPLYRVLGQALTALKQLIWGHKKAPQVGTDMFSNVRFNARVLMATPTPVALFMKDFGEVVMHQSTSFGSDPRLSEVRRRFKEHIAVFVNTNTTNNAAQNAVDYVNRRTSAQEALMRSLRVGQRMAIPFKLTMQQMSTFSMIGATLATAQHLNAASLSRMNEIYMAFIDKMTVEDFMENTGDPGADRYQAQQKYNAILDGGTEQLANFIGLATVNDQLRSILAGMTFPAKLMDKSWTADALFERAGSAVASGLANYASGQGRNNVDLLAAMEALTQNLIDNVGDQRSFIEHYADNGLDNADRIIKTAIEKGTKRIENWAKTLTNPIGQKAAKYLTILSRSLTEEGNKSLTRAGVSFFNQPEQVASAREAYNEVIGRTDENQPIFDMITRTRTFVDQTRQRWREEFPRELRKRFSRKLTKDEWADLHMMGQADAGALFQTYRKDRTLELISSGSERSAEVRSLEAKLSPQVIAKAKQLAHYMITGEHGPQLQRNAYAIAVLNGALENEANIENLVSLYAINNMPESTRNSLENLINTESQGFAQVFHSLIATRNDEMSKATTDIAKMNLFKGHFKGVNQDGVHMVIDEAAKQADYLSMGYEVLDSYKGSTADAGSLKRNYYFAPVSGRAKFNQGIMQTVQQSVFGVNPETGYSVGEINAGRITDPRAVTAITRRISKQLATNENLLPIYNGKGDIIGYERAADPHILTNINPEKDLATSLGAWRGRQSEEQASRIVNELLVDRVADMWAEGRREGRTNEFVDMSTSKDPIIADAWSVIPRETKLYIKSRFGNDGFRVRRDMLLDVAGARSASVGDFFTGNSRWSPEVQREIKDMIIGFGGNKAYTYLVNAEKLFQQVITDAKVMIVVKSVIVPAANIISNIYQLSMNGVPIRNIFSGLKRKTYELNTYIQQREQERQLQNDLFVAEGANDSVAMRKLSARIQALKDGYKNLSIWPLLEAGEFGAITEGGISQEDLAISKGGYAAFIEKMINKLPNNGLKDVVRYGMITRDTALFKALSRATQYGDFLAKAVLYDDLMRRKGMSQQEALAFVNEEFINYNRFAGRNRAYLESMGMTWFYNFKLRSIKVAQRAIHHHPVRALIHSALTPRLPFLGTVGNPMTDNMLSVIMNGRLGYSTGPNMLFRAPSFNPWFNLIN